MASPVTLRNKTRWGAPWSVAEVRQLGKVPDSVLARRRGRTIKEVVAEREARRIRLPTGPRRWTARELRLLGTMNDRELGRQLQRGGTQVRKKRVALGIPSYLPARKCRPWQPPPAKPQSPGFPATPPRLLASFSRQRHSQNQRLG
jgi:hypothetical protein